MKLKGIIITILLLITLSSISQNYSFFEFENLSNLSHEKFFQPQINVYASSFKTDAKVGVYFFALAQQNWGQAYGGIIIKPTNWLSINVGAGIEVDDNPYRFNITFQVVKNKFYFIQIYEYGGSGFWYHIQANYKILGRNYLGIILKRYYGFGIDYEYQLKKIPIRLVFSPLYDFEDDNYKLLIALRYTF